jgi:type IV pilus assembly protein PilO
MSGLFEPVITKKDWITVGSIVVGLVVVALVVAVFVYQPQRKELARLDGEIAAQEQELDALRETAAKKEELEARLKEIQQVVERFEAKLPTRKEIPKLFRKFQLAAGDANVVVESIEKLDEIKKPPRIDIPYQWTVSGSYHQIATFINTLETGERFVKITDVHIGEQKRGVSEAEFKLTTFLFVEEPEAVKPEGVQQ